MARKGKQWTGSKWRAEKGARAIHQRELGAHDWAAPWIVTINDMPSIEVSKKLQKIARIVQTRQGALLLIKGMGGIQEEGEDNIRSYWRERSIFGHVVEDKVDQLRLCHSHNNKKKPWGKTFSKASHVRIVIF